MTKKPNYVVDIRNLEKSFASFKAGGSYTTIKSVLLNLFSKKVTSESKSFSIDDLSIRIPKGLSVGIIGRNGSGKSTILKLITGIYKPDKGVVNITGRIAALIELGAGFHPDFTGRENLYLGGVISGLSKKEIDKRFDTIVEFAGLEKFIDQPVRTYSSGMFMRLGFSLAVHTDPDVLLVDEVLAVGDAAFVNKCKEKILSMKKSGVTLLLVSHDLDAVQRWSDEVVWLDKGKVMDRGEPKRVVSEYLSFLNKLENENNLKKKEQEIDKDIKKSKKEIERWGSKEVEITSVKLFNDLNKETTVFYPGDELNIEISYKKHSEVKDPVIGIAINRNDDLNVYGSNTDIEKVEVLDLKDEGKIVYKIKSLNILEGSYFIDTAIHRTDLYNYDYIKKVANFKIRTQYKKIGIAELDTEWSFL